MRQHVLTLQDLVQWSVTAALAVLLLTAVFAALNNRKRRRKIRERRRTCAQCGIFEEIASDGAKFGTCSVCGGVTSRGRSRKLG